MIFICSLNVDTPPTYPASAGTERRALGSQSREEWRAVSGVGAALTAGASACARLRRGPSYRCAIHPVSTGGQGPAGTWTSAPGCRAVRSNPVLLRQAEAGRASRLAPVSTPLPHHPPFTQVASGPLRKAKGPGSQEPGPFGTATPQEVATISGGQRHRVAILTATVSPRIRAGGDNPHRSGGTLAVLLNGGRERLAGHQPNV
jgi:hypothetical protein